MGRRISALGQLYTAQKRVKPRDLFVPIIPSGFGQAIVGALAGLYKLTELEVMTRMLQPTQ